MSHEIVSLYSRSLFRTVYIVKLDSGKSYFVTTYPNSSYLFVETDGRRKIRDSATKLRQCVQSAINDFENSLASYA